MSCEKGLAEEDAPLYSKSVLKHFDAAHKVELDIVKGATLALEQSNSSLLRI